MPHESKYPAVPSSFYVQRTPNKARLFLGEASSNSTALTPVATVGGLGDVEINRLVSALTQAAWLRDRSAWEEIAATLPEAVVLACDQVLASMPDPESFALGSDGRPLTVLRASSGFEPGDDELKIQARAAYDLSLQMLIDNYVDDDGEVCCRLRLLSGDIEVGQGDEASAWPRAALMLAERRLFAPSQLGEVLDDPRWRTSRTRLYWVWLADYDPARELPSEYSSEATWVVEYFNDGVPDDPEPDDPEEWETFVIGNWNPWPMTPRTRFLLWQSLNELHFLLELGLSQWSEGSAQPDDDDFMLEYPALVRSQPRLWWETLDEACTRLAEAMRTGDRWNPRTPAEEALIYIACRSTWTEAARAQIQDRPALRRQFENLPEGRDFHPDDDVNKDERLGPDYDWGEVPASLAGDEDIALLWRADVDGIERPDNVVNGIMGMGDYRAESWHQALARYAEDPDAPSALY